MGLKNLNFVVTLFFALLLHAYGKAIIQSNANDADFSSQPALIRRSPGLVVESQGYGGGANGDGGVSSTKMTMDGEPNGQQGLDVQSNAAGFGNDGMSATSLQFNKGDEGGDINVQSSAFGAGDEGAVSSTSLNYNGGNGNDGMSVQSNAVGVGDGDGGGGASQTTLQYTNDGTEGNNNLDVQANAVGAGDGNNGGGLGTTSVRTQDGDRTMEVQSTGVGVGEDGGLGTSSTSVHLGDNGLDDMTVDTTAHGYGEGDNAIGSSQTSLNTNVEKDVSSTPCENQVPDTNNLNNEQVGQELELENTAVGLANGDESVALTDTSLKTDNVDVESTGIASSGPDGAVGLSTNSLHINDAEEGNIDLGTAALGSNGEGGSRIGLQMEDGQNATNDDLTVQSTTEAFGDSEDGVAGSRTVIQVDDEANDRTLDAQSVGVGFTNEYGSGGATEESLQYHDLDEECHEVEHVDEFGASRSVTREVSDLDVQNTSSGYNFISDDGTTTHSTTQSSQTSSVVERQSYYTESSTIQNQGLVITGQEEQINQDQGYILQDQETLGLDQNQDVILNQNQEYVGPDHQIQTLDQGPDFVVQTVGEDQCNDVQGQQIETLNQGTDYVIQTNVNEDIVSDQQIQNLNQGQDFVVQTNLEEDQNHIVSGQQTQSIDQSQNYIVSNQQTQSQNYIESTQTQTVDQMQGHTVSSQQPTTGARQIDSPFLRNQPSSAICPDNNRGPGVVCYYQVSSIFEYENGYALYPNQIVVDYCDVLVVSYAILDFERLQVGAFSQEEEQIFSELVKLKNGRLRIILQLQYVAFYEQYINILNCDDNINQFISSVVNYLQQWNFDGIELPLLVPYSYDNIYAIAPTIKQRYAVLVQNLKMQLQQNNLLLSICLPIEPELIDLAYDISNILQYVDWFSVNTLDYSVPDEGVLRHTSPLTPESLDDPFCIDYTLNYLISELQVPTDKLIVNVGLYGSTFMLENYKEKTYGARVSGRGPPGPGSHADGFLTISELCSLTQINWLNNPAIVTDYDDVPTLVMKITYIRSRCLGGVGIHAVTMDDPKGRFCGRGPMPFTRAISLAYNPTRSTFAQNDGLELINYIDSSTTNKYEV